MAIGRCWQSGDGCLEEENKDLWRRVIVSKNVVVSVVWFLGMSLAIGYRVREVSLLVWGMCPMLREKCFMGVRF